MKHVLTLILSTLVLFYPRIALTQLISIQSSFNNLQLDQNVSIWQDTSKSWTIERILDSSPSFIQSTQHSLNFGYVNSYIWIRFDLINVDSVQKELLLEIENPHINKLQLFSMSGDSLFKYGVTGDILRFNSRAIAHPHFLFPIQLEVGQLKRFYLWVDKHGEQTQVPLRLWNPVRFNEHNGRMILFWGLMLGICSVFCFLSFLIFLFYRHQLNFYYWGYTCAMLIFFVGHTGLGFQYIWSNSIWWQSAARPTTALLIYTFYLLFTRAFFGISRKSRFLNFYTIFLLLVLTTLLFIFWSQNPILTWSENYWYNPDYYSGVNLLLFMKITGLVIIIVLLSILFIGLYFYFKEHNSESLWFSLSFVMLFFGGSSLILVFAGILPGNIFTKNLPLISNSLETIILALLIANRWNVVRLENKRMSLEISNQKQRSATQFIEGQMLERKRLSQQLHDGISLSLANIRLRLSMMSPFSPPHQSQINGLVEDLGEVSQDIRLISHDLSPVLLERYGLKDALEELIDQTQQAHRGIEIRYDHGDKVYINIPMVILQTIYFTVHELLANIFKHSSAFSISIQLNREDDILTLHVTDNGQGYDPASESDGIGLQNIYSRIDLLNGVIKVKQLEKGMSHFIRIPIPLEVKPT